MNFFKGTRRALLVMASVSFAASALAVEAPKQSSGAPAATGKPEDIRVQLAKRLPGAKPEDVRATPVNGMYEITLGGSTAYISADGKYLITGDLYEISSKTNLTEERRVEVRQHALATVKDADTIIFAPAAPAKYTLTVFTDTDCGYCRKLHSEIAELNKLGIRVRYAAYPRSGPGSDSWLTMESVWCAKDRRQALTRAKLGEGIAASKCGTTPVANQYRLGTEMGVNGTPAIFTEGGDLIGGYMPPQKLLDYLDELKSHQAVASTKAGG
jgi:thiol:disulfide interchange protein DsbC